MFTDAAGYYWLTLDCGKIESVSASLFRLEWYTSPFSLAKKKMGLPPAGVVEALGMRLIAKSVTFWPWVGTW